MIDDKLIWEVDSVKDVVSLGRSARNKANIKVRQPISEVSIYFKNKSKYNIEHYNNQIMEELNVKKVNFVSNMSEIVDYKIKPNFQ